MIVELKKFLLFLVLASALVLGCTSIDCPASMKVCTNYKVGLSETSDTLHDTLSVWTRRQNGTDTLILNRLTNRTAFQLPISYQRPEDTLMFAFYPKSGERQVDTVWLKKEDIPHFESVDCNPSFFHRIEAMRSTHHVIDTIIINRSSVDYDTTAIHFRISFKDGH